MVPARRTFWLCLLGLVLAALPLVVSPMAWPGVVALWVALAIGLSVDGWALWRARPLVVPEVPAWVGVGDPVRIELAVRLAGRWPLMARFRGEVTGPLEPGEDLATQLPVGACARAIELDAPQRGLGRLAALWSQLDGPLGLLQRIDRHPLDDARVAIVPNARRVRELALRHFGSQTGGQRVMRQAGEGGEFDAMVGYVTGMDPRKVDWKSSARHQSLRIRRYRTEKNQRLVLCVDTGRLMSDPIDGIQRLDHAIVSAMVLAQTALRAGDLVGMFAYGSSPETWVAPGGSMRQAARIDRACAALHPEPAETNHALGIHALLTKLRRRSLVIVFTELSDATTAELMIESLGHLVRRHLVVFVALDDPTVEQPLAVAPKRAEDLAAGVIAGHLRQNRQRVLRRLQRMGVDVVQGRPGPATLRLLARYLSLIHI